MRRILSIDGGGIRGVIPAMVLQELERRTGRPISEQFDLIAGTSTGGLIALAFTCPGDDGRPKFDASGVLALYEGRGREIFHIPLSRKLASAGGTLKAKYGHAALERVLLDYFGSTRLGEALTRVLVSSYDIEHREPYFFKSWHPETGGVEMRRVGRATSAAPTYFEPAMTPVPGGSRPLVDGGVFVNNPAMSAYAEACRLFPGETDFTIVAIGTGISTEAIPYEKARGWGLVGWARPVIDVVFDGVSDAVDYQLDHILGDRYFRFQTQLAIAKSDLGDASPANIDALKLEAEHMLRDRSDRFDQLCALLGSTRVPAPVV